VPVDGVGRLVQWSMKASNWARVFNVN